MAKILDGKSVSKKWREEIKQLIKEKGIRPVLWVILAGDDPASQVYVRNKVKAGESIGVKVEVKKPGSEAELFEVISEANSSEDVDGLIVQLPLPDGYDRNGVIEAISPEKDVDGLTSKNLGLLFKGIPGFVPCTPLGIMKLLDEYSIDLEGKRVLVIGRSELVGKPLSALLLSRNATVSIAHSKTRDLPDLVKESDAVFVAVGRSNFLKKEWVKDGAIVVDVGINRVGDRLVGDVSPDVAEVASFITPVPGGVGPMTVSALMYNTYLAALNRRKLS